MKTLERIAPLDRIIVSHPMLMQAQNGIESCVAKTEIYREPTGCLLLSEGGNGKTTLCKLILKKMPPSTVEEANLTRRIIPAFYTQVPAPASVASLAAGMLRKLNDPSPHAGTVAQKTERLCKLLVNCETKLVLLDEFHHLIDVRKKSTRVNTIVCDWVKTLADESGVSFCLVGLPAIASIFTSDTQLARRFPMRFSIRRLYSGSESEPGTLEGFLNSLARAAMEIIGLKGFPSGDDTLFASQVYSATQGIPAFIMALVREAIFVGLTSGRDCVERRDFAQAWNGGICGHSSLTGENPFLLAEADLRRSVKVGKR